MQKTNLESSLQANLITIDTESKDTTYSNSVSDWISMIGSVVLVIVVIVTVAIVTTPWQQSKFISIMITVIASVSIVMVAIVTVAYSIATVAMVTIGMVVIATVAKLIASIGCSKTRNFDVAGMMQTSMGPGRWYHTQYWYGPYILPIIGPGIVTVVIVG